MKDFMKSEPGVPAVVDRDTFQSELDALRVREGSGLDLWIGSDIHTKFIAVDEQTNDHIVQPD